MAPCGTPVFTLRVDDSVLKETLDWLPCMQIGYKPQRLVEVSDPTGIESRSKKKTVMARIFALFHILAVFRAGNEIH